jgi:hypothetical protein
LLLFPSGQLGNQLFGLACALHHNQYSTDKIYVLISNTELLERIKSGKAGNLREFNVVVVSNWIVRLCISYIFRTLDYCGGKQFFNWAVIKLERWFKTLEHPWLTIDFETSRGPRCLLVRGYFQNVEMIKRLSYAHRKALMRVIGYAEGAGSEIVPDTIGLHVRRGDYEKISDYGTLSLDYFLSAVTRLAKPDNTVVASSDSETTLDMLSQRIKVIKLLPSRVSPLKTIQTLARSNCFIMSNSTFSFWIGWLVSESGGIVVAPDPWFRKTEVPNDYLFLDTFLRNQSHFD